MHTAAILLRQRNERWARFANILDQCDKPFQSRQQREDISDLARQTNRMRSGIDIAMLQIQWMAAEGVVVNRDPKAGG